MRGIFILKLRQALLLQEIPQTNSIQAGAPVDSFRLQLGLIKMAGVTSLSLEHFYIFTVLYVSTE
jgi:hypothetical protein